MKKTFTLWAPVLCLVLFSTRSLAQANTRLSNLVTPTSINTNLLPKANNAYNLGSPGLQWNNLFVTNLNATGSAQLNNVTLSGPTQFFGEVLFSPTAIFNNNTLSFLGSGGLNFAGGGEINFGGGGQINFRGPSAITMSGGGKVAIDLGSFTLNQSTFTITPGKAGVLLSDAGGTITSGALTLAQIPSLSSLYLPLAGGKLTGRLEGTEAVFSGRGRFTSVETDRLRAGGTIYPADMGTRGQVLTANGSGDASWVTPAATISSGWSLTGNAGTVDGTNFIGTTDNVPLTIRVNDLPSGRIDPTLKNAFWGYQAAAGTTGTLNTAIGNLSLATNTSGNGLTAIGAGADILSDNISNSTAIGSGAVVRSSNSMQLGNGKVTTVYLGGSSTTLITAGLQVTGGTLAAGYVLTSDSNGVATWKAPSSGSNSGASSGWSLTGNAGTVDGTNFIGTTDNVPLTIRVNNFQSGRIDPTLNNAVWGYLAFVSNTNGSHNAAFGPYALYSNSAGAFNTATGSGSLQTNSSGSSNTGLGFDALEFNSTGNLNTALGALALGENQTGSNLTAIGANADVATGGLTNSTAIGYGAKATFSNVVQLGNYAVDSIYAGVGTAATLVTGGLKVVGGKLAAGSVLTSDANGVATWQPLPAGTGGGSGSGSGSSWSLTGNTGTVDGTNFIGTTDNVPLTIRVWNAQSGRIDPNLENASWGFNAASNNTTGNSNVSIGSFSLYSSSTGSLNTAIGYQALNSNLSGISNTAVGANALIASLGTENTGVGSNALQNNVSGSDVTGIGSNAGPGLPNLTNATAIGANAVVTGSNDIQLGSGTVDTVYVGVGKIATLVTGGLIVKGGNLAVGNVLTSDANGVATWQPPASGSGTGSSSSWSLTGNAGTVDGTNFIGTTDNVPLTFKIAGYQAGRLDGLFQNTFLGVGAGNSTINSTGAGNTFIGFNGASENTSGSSNTAIGGGTFYNNNSGNYLTAIGFLTDVTEDGLSNSTALGANATITANNQVRIGSSTVTSIGGYANWTNFSDGRYKRNIQQNVPGLAFINALQPITYTLDVAAIENKLHGSQLTMKGPDGKPMFKPAVDANAMAESSGIIHTGFIAQDVDKAAQKLGYDFSGVDRPKDDSKSFYGLRYGDFVVPLVKAVQELSSKNDSLTAVVAQLQDSLNSVVGQMNDRLNKLEAALGNGAVSQNSFSVLLSSAKLSQNVPNPFNQTTQINYYLPDNTGSALIRVTDMNGATIKSFALNGKGSGQLTLATAQLAAGTYAYTLIVDGNIIDTKTMVLVK